ncbi:MAG: ATP-binding protein [Terracidiphilus sp.]|jgi:signal transduction histidine kinase
MNLRQRLLLLLSLTVAVVVAAVAWTVLVRIRQVFEQRDQQETALFVSQFQREFQHRSAEVAAAVDRIAATERVRAMAFSLAQSGDASLYVNEAQTLAQDAQLDFLEIIGPDGNIVSSAQWPARFGYPEQASYQTASTFLKSEELPDGTSVLGLFATRVVHRYDATGTQPVHILGGKRLDQSFLADLPVAPGMTVSLYREPSSTQKSAFQQLFTPFDPSGLIDQAGPVANAASYQSLIDPARRTCQMSSGILYPTSRREDSVNATAIPLKNDAGSVLAVLTVAISRGGMIEAQQQIRRIAYGVAAGGILLAILASLWIAARVSRPIEQLARAAEEVASGNWETSVPERKRKRGRDEIDVLARGFNHMTDQLASQRERLVQSERVAAWRELARRLAHELKNPLFPLQLTVENLVRARALPEAEFDEVFRESTATLGMEIANLKTIIGRFSDFSKMPKPLLERFDAKDALERVRSLYEAASQNEAKICFEVELSPDSMPLDADPELLHRALSNLVLNAMDAMPDGGTLTLSAKPRGDWVEIRVSDTGTGLAPEECERLFTPYYTTKQHGTGLGLAIVQSVIADHAGTIAVESRPGDGSVFVIALPMNRS